MSLERATAAIDAILEYEDCTNLYEVWEASNKVRKEFGYIINQFDIVTKVIGTAHRLPRKLFEEIDLTNSCSFHTHPGNTYPELSAGDIKSALWRYEHNNADGTGIIAKYSYLYAEIKPETALRIAKLKSRILAEWRKLPDKYYKYRAEGDIASANQCAKQARSYKAQMGSLTRAAREAAFDIVIEGDTYW